MNLPRFIMGGCEFVRVADGVYECTHIDARIRRVHKGWYSYLGGRKLRTSEERAKLYISGKGAASAAVRAHFKRWPGKPPAPAGRNAGRHRTAYLVKLPDGREEVRGSFTIDEPVAWVFIKKWHRPLVRWITTGLVMETHERPKQPRHGRYTVQCVQCHRIEKL